MCFYHRIFLRFVLIIGGLLAPSVDVRAESEAEMAEEAAEEIADELASKLKDEKSKVIFINLQECDPSITGEKHWCKLFFSKMQSTLSGEKIRFLNESQSNAVRKKIVDEQLYQHGSKQVDVAKAVALGKQDAFHAFVSVSVDGSAELNSIQISVQSVKIKLAAISISLTRNIKYERSPSTSFGRVFKGLMVLGVGAAGLSRTMEIEKAHQDKADKAYLAYETASTEEDAVKFRKEVQTHDQKVDDLEPLKYFCLFTAVVGGFYMFSEGEEELSYDIAERGEIHKGESFWKVSPVLATDNVGLSLGFHW